MRSSFTVISIYFNMSVFPTVEWAKQLCDTGRLPGDFVLFLAYFPLWSKASRHKSNFTLMFEVRETLSICWNFLDVVLNGLIHGGFTSLCVVNTCGYEIQLSIKHRCESSARATEKTKGISNDWILQQSEIATISKVKTANILRFEYLVWYSVPLM